MNLSDGGKNRREMRDIGLLGCKSVLEKLGKWKEGMHLPEARHLLYQWDSVINQMTRIEALCYEHGIVLIYQSKAHPLFNPTEVHIFGLYLFID